LAQKFKAFKAALGQTRRTLLKSTARARLGTLQW